jgi:uncharacterized protein (TIGR03382 family)
VVSTGAKTVRFYESAVRGTYTVAAADGGMGDELPKYVIRYSDDLGKTWTEHEFGMTDGAVRLLAVDPTDGNRIVVGVLRDQTNAEGVSLPDDILYSDTAGKPGSFETIGQVTELGGASFAPDGRFFYGDREQTTPALYAVKKLGDAPKKLQSKDKIQCVNYDAPSDTLYVCKDRELCTADPSTGALTMLFDVTKEDAFVSCDGETAVFDRCQQQLASGWCGITHYPTTPICADYHIPGWDSGVPGGDAGVGSGGSAGGGDKGGAGSDADGGKKSDGKKSSGGCSSAGGSSRASGVGLGAWLALFAVALLQRRRRATRAAR